MPASRHVDHSKKWFEPTRWTLVRRAQADDPEVSRKALGELFKTYHRVLVRAARWHLNTANQNEAEEIVQGFFAWLVRKDFVRRATPDRGLFRTFVLRAMQRYHWHELERDTAQKRGGDEVMVELNEEVLDGAPSVDAEAGLALDREWARETLAAALESLRSDYAKRGQETRFGALNAAVLDVKMAGDLPALQAQAGMTGGNFAVEVHRFRARLKEAFRKLVRETVSTRAEEAEEFNYLLGLLLMS
jgi:RNA polymerase sigma-70 factor (ECF subfamily)